MAASFGVKLAIEPVGNQRIEVRARDSVNGTALPPIATVRATTWHELLSTEAHAAVAAVTGLNADVDFVDEQDRLIGELRN